MPDYPHVHGSLTVRPVGAGGTRIRLVRRRPGEAEGEETGENSAERKDQRDSAWRALIEEAVRELDASLRAAGAPFTCGLEEDEDGLILQVRRHRREGVAPEVEEEYLEPTDLPEWLARIRSRLGILVDETA